MKIAICMSGQPRQVVKSMEHFMKFIRSANPDADVFFHTWFDPSKAGQKFDSAQAHQNGNVGAIHPDTVKILMENLKPVSYKIEIPKDSEFVESTRNYMSSPNADQAKLMSLFYSLKYANDLKRAHEISNNFVYDIVVRLRMDLHYSAPVNFMDFKNHLDHVITSEKFQLKRMGDVPGLGNYTMDDIFAVSSSSNMDKYSEVFSRMGELNSTISPPYGENYLGYVVRTIHKIPVAVAPVDIEIMHRINNE